jgi:16S rRNA (cytidine1402-2'-O)-methyltransferase
VSGTLWLVATPIGNLGDLQPRAIEVLAAAELVCCEDTRRTGLLLHHSGVKAKRMAVCNEHTEHDLIDRVLGVLGSGGDVAVVKAAVDASYNVSSVPGPSAAVMAVTISGLDTSRFVFEGFLPRKGRERATRLAELACEPRTSVLYEAPHRALRTLSDLGEACGPDRDIVVTRELTKLHETVVRGTLGSIDIGDPRGEYVFVLAGVPIDKTPATDEDVQRLLDESIADGMSKRDAAAAVAEQTGRSRRDVYQLTI